MKEKKRMDEQKNQVDQIEIDGTGLTRTEALEEAVIRLAERGKNLTDLSITVSPRVYSQLAREGALKDGHLSFLGQYIPVSYGMVEFGVIKGDIGTLPVVVRFD